MREDREENGSSGLMVGLYSSLLLKIWEIVSELIGEAILELLFTLAIRKMGEKYPFLNSLKVTEEGVSMDSVKEACRAVPTAEIHRGFQGLVTHLFDIFSALTEAVVSRELFPKVFPKVREAERLVSQK